MKTPKSNRITLVAAAVAAVLLASCASAPVEPEGAAALRARLIQLQSDPQLGNRAPLAMQQAGAAVTAAEQPETDKTVSDYRLFIADRKISIAQADAQSQLAIDQRKGLEEQREAMRLQERTQEADAANRRANVAQANALNQTALAQAANSRAMAAQADASDQAQQANAARADAASQTQQADVARADAASQLQQADVARADAASQMQQADVARADAASQAQQADAARAAAAELQQQINGLQAKVTDRGLVLTLGDVLFTSGSANLNARGDSHLAKLAEFLNKYGSRTALIEGHTDNVGGQDYNLGLSQRRADAVKAYLVNQGIDASRLSASGKGKDSPIADNSTAIGRQENRRVEVIIQNNQVSSL